jgi:glycosyltransferase involved in cell wall biosynthesis
MSAGLRVACWRAAAAGDEVRLAALAECARRTGLPIEAWLAGPQPALALKDAGQAQGVAIEHLDAPELAQADLVLALAPDEPGLDLPLPVVASLPQGVKAPKGVFGLVEAEAGTLGAALAFLALYPDVRRGLKRERLGPDLPDGSWLVYGPFDSSFSLAIVNRELARALSALGVVSALDGPQYRAAEPAWEALAQRFEIESLYAQRQAQPAVVLGNDYPPPCATLPRAPLALLANYAWEESGYPAGWVRAFNAHLDALTVVCPMTKRILRDAGVKRPIAVVGNGIDHLLAVEPRPADVDLGRAGHLRILHVSSCLPRKGIDSLAHAFAQAFGRSDAVTLIVKTVANEANIAAEALEKARAMRGAEAPQMILIDQDLAAAEMVWLYRQCHVLALTPRAEGFGLPLAEAALAGLACITSAYGGHRCLVDADTAFLVPGELAPARSHLGIRDSLWFEPDVEAMTHVLRTVAATPRETLRAMAQRLAERLLQSYRWEQVARRTRKAVKMLWQRPMLPREGRIAWLSTWNSRCGLATYSQHLTATWPRERLWVLANQDAEPIMQDERLGVPVRRLWQRGRLEVEETARAVLAAGCQAVVAQHHPGLYAAADLGRLAQRLAADGVRCYAVLHNTAQLDASQAQALVSLQRVLVHSVQDVNRLLQWGLAGRVTLFPHGLYPAPASGTLALPEMAGLQGRRLVATFGFLRPHKGLVQVIEAFALLARRFPTLHLLMLNALFPAADSGEEERRVRQAIARLGLDGRVTLLTEFLPDEQALAWLSAAEAAVFAYQHTDESASGAVRMALAAGCPVLATPLPIFADVAEVVESCADGTPQGIAAGLERLLQRTSAEREALRQRIAEFAAARRWPVLGERLLNLIDGDANDPFPDELLPLESSDD